MAAMTTAPIDPDRLAEVDRLAERELEESGVPGMSIGIVGVEGPPVVRTYGWSDLAARLPVAPETLFEIGSIGKTFTAIAILQLAEEGRLDLGAPVSDALPWFEMPVVGRPVTIHDLLTHTAGITSGIDGTPEAAFQVRALRDRRPGSAPGERYHYSNLGYKILGLVIEAVEGRPYPEAVRERILDPLGMAATEPAITHDIRQRLAVGYGYLHDDRIGYPGRPLAPATWLETATGDGSIASTAGDMAAFARMLLRRGEGPDGRLVSEASFVRMVGPYARTPRGNGYGYGLFTVVAGGRTFLGHPGGMVGYLSALHLDPAAGLGVIVLENATVGDPLGLARVLLDTLRGPAAVTDPAPSSAPAGDLPDGTSDPDRTGVYHADTDDPPLLDLIEIVAGVEGPALRWRGRLLALEALGDGRFLVPDPDLDQYALRFEPAGERPDLAWHGPTRYVRDGATVPRLPAPDPTVTALAGHYRSHDPWLTNFRVILRGDVLWLVLPTADGFEDEQPLVARADGSFRVGDDPAGPEDVRFDTVVDGRPLQAWLSGYPYHRVG
jgi:CubicO group peptidase (beta-lactamase class C family)